MTPSPEHPSKSDADADQDPYQTLPSPALPEGATEGSGFASIQGTIGPYALLERIGTGGMGEVWVAEQSEPVKRRVALKLIKEGIGSRETIARFEAERQALAMMNHPNIARILDAGTTAEGQPYFVMELVAGKPLTQYCDEHKLSIDQRLKLFLDVCGGVQHAHQKGIIHRDLKPGNIIVGLQDGVPVPKIIDFGLAKAMESTQRLTDQSLFTGIGQILGTLKYMSPEQASLDNLDIDTRTDIYALGVILYELLTGSTPLDDSSIQSQAVFKILELIREKEPVKPSRKLGSSTDEQVSSITGQRQTDSVRLKRILLGDLDWIVMKALEKDRTRRYDSASGFAADICRYLNSEPVIARPPSLNYRVRKFLWKHRHLAIITTCFISVLSGLGFLYLNSLKSQLEAEIQANNSQRKATRVLDFLISTFERPDPTIDGKDVRVIDVLETAISQLKDSETDYFDLEETAEIQIAVGKTYLNLGLYDRSSQILAEAAKSFSKTKSTLESIRTNLLLAESLAYENKLVESKALYETLVTTLSPIQSQFWEEYYEAKGGLAYCIAALGDFQGALPLMEECVNGLTQRSGESNRNSLEAMNNLAFAYNRLGKTREAAELHLRVLAIREKAFGETDPHTLISLNNIGVIMQARGELEEAVDIFKRVLEKRRQLFDEANPDIIMSRQRLAYALYLKNQSADSVQQIQTVVEDAERSMPRTSPWLLNAKLELANCLRGFGKFSESEEILQEILRLTREDKNLLEEFSDSLLALIDLRIDSGTDLTQLSNFIDSEKTLPGPSERHVASLLLRMIECQLAQQNRDEAKRILLGMSPTGFSRKYDPARFVSVRARLTDDEQIWTELVEKTSSMLASPSSIPLHEMWLVIRLCEIIRAKLDEQGETQQAKEWQERSSRIAELLSKLRD
jgi:serine/threonine protein kinase